MVRIIGIDCVEWDNIVESFPNYDVYYLSGYVRAFQIHGDGIPQLFYYDYDGLRALYVYMKRHTFFSGIYDTITPYGYGGFIVDGDVCEEKCNNLWNEYVHKMQELHIVDNFVRYHPVLQNADSMRGCSEIIDIGKTIVMNLDSVEIIWGNLNSKNRNMIRKAEKNGIEIKHGDDWALFDQFISIYNATMDRDNADKYYYFQESFYRSILKDLAGHFEIFYAVYNNITIAMSIVIFANNKMHYHLSGSLEEYRHLAPTNLLLYKAAVWGVEQGFKTFHLGGGVGSREDNLYKFKAAFNRNSNCQFSIAKHVFDETMYNRLVEERTARDIAFNRNSSFFPLYRS